MVELTQNRGSVINLRISFFARRRDDYYYDDYDRGRRQTQPQPQRDYYDRREDDYRARESPKRPPPRKNPSGSSAGSIASVAIRIILIIALVLFLIMPEFQSQREELLEAFMAGMYKYQEVPESAEFSVQRTFTIKSTGELNYTLYLPIPPDMYIDGKEAQKNKGADLNPKYSEITYTDEEDRNRNRDPDQWVWHGSMKGGGTSTITHTITITYHFKTAKIEFDVSIPKSGTIADIPNKIHNGYDKGRFLRDAWPVADYQDSEGIDTDSDGIPDTEDVDDNNDGRPDKFRIEPSNPSIRELLLDILNEKGLYSGNDLTNIGHLNVYEVVKAIYDHIDHTCYYPTQEQMYEDAIRYGSYPKWSTGTYADKRGDCDDQSILFISLCRAAGIPAMLEIGALYDPNMDQWEGHGWANVYIPYTSSYSAEKGVDHVLPMVDIVNDIFKFRDPNRFSEWVDDGISGRIDPDTGEWENSHLEKRYLAWEYIRGDSSVDVDIQEEYKTLEFKAYAPEQKLYI